MQFIDCSYSQFLDIIVGKKIIVFGAVMETSYLERLYPNIHGELFEKISYVVDNNIEKQKIPYFLSGIELEVKSPYCVKNEKDAAIIIFAPTKYQREICAQLSEINTSEKVFVFSIQLMQLYKSNLDDNVAECYLNNLVEEKIPPIIHSFWFSGEKKPYIYERCIESWKKNCPNYEIIEWNTENYNIRKNEYMYEAYKRKKWAFVSDYARLDVVYKYGGIYLDMDVELIKNMDDFRKAGAFFCRQENCTLDLGSGFGAVQHHKFLKVLLNMYERRMIYDEQGEFVMIDQPSFLFPTFFDYGVKIINKTQLIEDSLILNENYFTVGDHYDPENKKTVAIHWHNGGWLSDVVKQEIADEKNFQKELRVLYFKKTL